MVLPKGASGCSIGRFSDDKRRNDSFSYSHSTANGPNPGKSCKIDNRPERRLSVMMGLKFPFIWENAPFCSVTSKPRRYTHQMQQSCRCC